MASVCFIAPRMMSLINYWCLSEISFILFHAHVVVKPKVAMCCCLTLNFFFWTTNIYSVRVIPHNWKSTSRDRELPSSRHLYSDAFERSFPVNTTFRTSTHSGDVFDYYVAEYCCLESIYVGWQFNWHFLSILTYPRMLWNISIQK